MDRVSAGTLEILTEAGNRVPSDREADAASRVAHEMRVRFRSADAIRPIGRGPDRAM